jgi:hypothetical protein
MYVQSHGLESILARLGHGPYRLYHEVATSFVLGACSSDIAHERLKCKLKLKTYAGKLWVELYTQWLDSSEPFDKTRSKGFSPSGEFDLRQQNPKHQCPSPVSHARSVGEVGIVTTNLYRYSENGHSSVVPLSITWSCFCASRLAEMVRSSILSFRLRPSTDRMWIDQPSTISVPFLNWLSGTSDVRDPLRTLSGC